jgi:hypothetical protein
MPPMKWRLIPLAAGVAVVSFSLYAQNEIKPNPASGQEQDGKKILLDPKVVLPEPADHPRFARVQIEFVELSHEKLTDLLFMDDPASADGTTLRKQIQEMVKKDEAKIMETMVCTARSGEKALTECINEFIYPTEYEPSSFSSLPTETDLTPEKVELMRKLRTLSTPTSYETRNLGGTFEIEPTISDDGRLIDLRFAPEFVWHTGQNVWSEEKDADGNVAKSQMPKIYTMRITTALTCREGQYVMAGILSPKDAEGATDPTRKVMVFVKCDVLTVK